jgi:hypothetical protein
MGLVVAAHNGEVCRLKKIGMQGGKTTNGLWVGWWLYGQVKT